MRRGVVSLVRLWSFCKLHLLKFTNLTGEACSLHDRARVSRLEALEIRPTDHLHGQTLPSTDGVCTHSDDVKCLTASGGLSQFIELGQTRNL